MHFSFCTIVPAAGINPEDSEVEPLGVASLSRIIMSSVLSLAASAAVNPHAPAPTIATSTYD